MRFATSLILLTMPAAPAFAGAALDDEKKPTPTTDPAASPDNLTTVGEKVDYGIDLRIRSVHLPAALMGLFVGHTPGGASNTGIGVDLVRRRGNLELQLGFEYEHINMAQGVFIESGKNVANGDAADYILGPDVAPENFGWFTIEFTFMNHAPINKYLSFRYGGGAGLGILTGGVYRYDIDPCGAGATNDNPEPGCKPPQFGGTGQTADDNSGAPESSPVKYNIPPVFPVVNAIIGLQIRPTEKSVINIEGGIRTLPFFGISAGYFFP